MDNIADDALDAIVSKNSRFDLKARCLQVANDGIKKKEKGIAEYKAYLVLQSFASNVLNEGIKDFKGLHNIMVFSRFDHRAIDIINSE